MIRTETPVKRDFLCAACKDSVHEFRPPDNWILVASSEDIIYVCSMDCMIEWGIGERTKDYVRTGD